MTSPPAADAADAEIRRLVAQAERVVWEGAQEAGRGRVSEWLRRRRGRRAVDLPAADRDGQGTDHSCDASGECTSGDSDAGGDSTSESEGLDCSVVTCRRLAPASPRLTGCQESAPTQASLLNEPGLPGQSPASSQTPSPADQLNQSPLGQLDQSVPGHPDRSSPGPPALSPPSQLVFSSSPAEAAAAETPTSSSGGSTILSGFTHQLEPASHVALDPPTWAGRRRARARRPIAAQSSGSEGGTPGSPTRHRRRGARSPSGGVGGGCKVADPCVHGWGQAADRSGLQLSCATDATLEDLSPGDVSEDTCDVTSSVSEQAWDPYQEYKEITELGSESSVDPDALLRFLDCDDYRNFIDSHSDCTSSQVSSVAGTRRPPPPRRHRRKLRAAGDSADSDTDGDELPAALDESRRRLLLAQTELGRRAAQLQPICSGILAACRAELGRLEQLLTVVDPLGLGRDLSSPYIKPAVAEVKGVIQQWQKLGAAAMELQQRADGLGRLQERIRSFRHGLATLDERTARFGRDVATIDDLQARISSVKSLQQELADQRQTLLDINADVHAHVTSFGGQSPLKEDVATLYRIWEEVDHRSQAQLEHLTAAAATWQEFIAARAELASALEADRRRLGLLQEALTSGDADLTGADVTDADVTGSDVTGRSGVSIVASETQAADAVARSGAGLDELSEGTSGYDSACSDDLSERERRLGRLRRMACDLESLLSPGGEAWSDIRQTLTTATTGLRELQQSCRHLVAKTASQFQPEGGRQRCSPLVRRKSYTSSRRERARSPRGRGGRRGWLRRVIGAALPFQLGLLLWLCAACLLEPSCCDDLNTLTMSLTPQLRYVDGPPPI